MKNLKVPIMTVLFLLVMFTVVSTAQASAIPDFSKERPVLEAISLLYAPTPDNHSSWQDSVCERMTEGGCGYFTDQLESRLWKSGQDIAFESAWSLRSIATLEDDSQVWKAAVVIYKNCGEAALKNCPSIQSDLYLHAVYDETQKKWLLNRVLYGPYIEEQ